MKINLAVSSAPTDSSNATDTTVIAPPISAIGDRALAALRDGSTINDTHIPKAANGQTSNKNALEMIILSLYSPGLVIWASVYLFQSGPKRKTHNQMNQNAPMIAQSK